MVISISVRDLVEFIQRSGDIDNRRIGGGEDAMLEGSRLHRMLQKRMGSEYTAEVPLQYCVENPGYEILISGRADGVIRNGGRVVVDEIKCTFRDLNRIGEPVGEHLSQARCYAYFIAEKEDLDEIGVRMTYCHIKTRQIRYFHENLTRSELRAWFDELIGEYKKWTDFEFEWKQKRQTALQQLEFPYAFREGQKELSGYVYQTICHRKKLFIQAPTGVGKTLSCMYPALKAIGAEKADKLFYLTAKTVTAAVAVETVKLLADKGMAAKTLVITAKDKICPMEQAVCNPDACPYAKGHFDRINDAVYELLTEKDFYDRDIILEAAGRHMVCPFEFSLDMSLFADVVICDYNYLFDPYVRLKRFFSEGVKGSFLFLVDEAHNLLERGRNMYSAQLLKEDILGLKRKVQGQKTGLDRYLDRVNRQFLALKKEPPGEKSSSRLSELNAELLRLYGEMSTLLEDDDRLAPDVREPVLEYYFQLRRYMDTWERYDERYLSYTSMTENDEFALRLFCVDPSRLLNDCMQLGQSTILFSATLLPIQFYKGLLGGEKEDYEVYARTSFSEEQFCVLIGGDVTTKYSERSEALYERIAADIDRIVRAHEGNYMVFCPSYQFQQSVLSAYEELFYDPDKEELLVQTSGMDEQERELFLGRFDIAESKAPGRPAGAGWQSLIQMEIEQEKKNLLGFCVLGGVFAEGIDLKGESLIGAIVVGTGLPQISPEGELLKSYFEKNGKNGFDYAYRYPGMNKVLQAAGRVIRTRQDRGVIALLDYRFCQSEYRNLFPREWKNAIVVRNNNEWNEILSGFWNG